MFADRTQWNLAPNRLAEALARHRAGERRLLDLTASNPTECGFHYDERTILDALEQPQALHYRPDPRGLASAREAVRDYYSARHEGQVTTEQILLTTSTSEAYSFVFRLLCNPGDEVLVPYRAILYLSSSPTSRTSSSRATRSSTITAGTSISTLWSRRLPHAPAR